MTPVSEFRDDIPRGGLLRAVSVLACGLGLLQTNGVDGNAGLTIGTDPTKVASGSATTYRIDGTVYSLPATDNFWTLIGAPVPASSWQKYALLVDTESSSSVVAGESSNVSAARVKLAPLGTTGGQAVIGTLTVATAADTTFKPGIDALNAPGVTATFTSGVDTAAMIRSVGAIGL